MIDLGGEVGPEHVALGPDGRLYVAVASGNILRMAPDGAAREVFANTGGRVLGFAFDAAGNLVAADAVKGLLSVTSDGRVTLLADNVGGEPIRYAPPMARSSSPTRRRASAPPAGAAPSRRAFSTSSSSRRPAACSSSTRRRRRCESSRAV